ncbi:hypothetical protein WR25_14937 [Diploscapter pachys]|uniref:Uncharacterized protein n=1 Tax=Diploscapter pachys TaxID=2018661 RepID=A0A2A2LS36_9BILA|nr:hypothetical protein WR25_14937 [Diploscapter pachys]
MDIAATFDHEPFRHMASKYRCLCNRMHSKQGTRYLGYLLVAIFIIGLALMALNIYHGTWPTLGLHVFVLIGIFLVAICIILAMKTEKELLLLPAVLLCIIGVLVGLVFLIVSIWSLIDPQSDPAKVVNNFVVSSNQTLVDDNGLSENRGSIQVVSAVGAALSLLGIAICIWVAIVLFKYYTYLRDMKRARNPRNEVHYEVSTIKKGMHQ